MYEDQWHNIGTKPRTNEVMPFIDQPLPSMDTISNSNHAHTTCEPFNINNIFQFIIIYFTRAHAHTNKKNPPQSRLISGTTINIMYGVHSSHTEIGHYYLFAGKLAAV